MLKAKTKVKARALRVGLYIRVSTEEQASNPEGSIKSQEQRLRMHLDLKNQENYLGEVTHVFTDTRSGKDMSRRELQRLLNCIRAGEIDLLMVSELSRLSRSIKDFSQMWELMQEHDCGFLSLRENFDTTTAAGEMVLYTVANIAQFERKQTSERISANFMARAERGLYNGGSVPFGFSIDPEKPGYLIVNEAESPIVLECFKSYMSEGCLSKACKSLNERGVRLTRNKLNGGHKARLGHFTFDNLESILKNKSYLGLRVFKDRHGDEKISKAVWPAIVSQELFEKVEAKLKANRYRYKSDSGSRFPFLLSGLCRCGTCGDRLPGKSAHGNGGKVPYYEHGWAMKRQACLTKKIFTCSPHRVQAKILEPLVWGEIEKLLHSPHFAKSLIDEATKFHQSQGHVTKVEKLRMKTKDLEIQLDALAEHLSKLPKGVSAHPIYNQMARIEELKNQTLTEIDEVSLDGKLLDPPTSLKSYEDFLANLRAVLRHSEGTELKTKLAHKLIHKVEVFPDRVRIYFKVGRSTIGQGFREIQLLEQGQALGTKKAASGALAPDPLSSKNSGSSRLTYGRRGGI